MTVGLYSKKAARFFAFAVFFLLGPVAWAGADVENNNAVYARDQAINQELDCVEKNLNGEEVNWNEVCYTSSYNSDRENQSAPEPLPSPPTKKPFDFYGTEEVDDYDLPNEALNRRLNQTHYFASSTEAASPVKFDLQLLTGYREDDFDWNIAGDNEGLNPNIISELTWSDLKMYEIKGKGRVTFLNHLVFDGMYGYASITAGDNQDSDYAGDDRTSEFSRSNNSADDGNVREWSVAGGYKVSLTQEDENYLFPELEDFYITALVGYSRHEQDLSITDGFQTLPPLGSFDGLQSTYETEWSGPWVGAELSGSMRRFLGSLRFEYHFVDYEAEANWNLRPDFQHPKSFEHIADGGYGLVFSGGGGYQLTDNWSLDLNIDWQNWKMLNGTSRFFLSTGETPTQRLNEVNWKSFSVMVGTSYHFF